MPRRKAPPRARRSDEGAITTAEIMAVWGDDVGRRERYAAIKDSLPPGSPWHALYGDAEARTAYDVFWADVVRGSPLERGGAK